MTYPSSTKFQDYFHTRSVGVCSCAVHSLYFTQMFHKSLKLRSIKIQQDWPINFFAEHLFTPDYLCMLPTAVSGKRFPSGQYLANDATCVDFTAGQINTIYHQEIVQKACVC